MNIFRDGIYWVRRALLGTYGPATLDPEHDPVEQLKREHEADVQTDEQAEAAAEDPAADRPSTS